MKKLSFFAAFALILLLPSLAHAAGEKLILKVDYHQIWEVDPALFSSVSNYQKTTLKDLDIVPLKEQSKWLEPYLETREVEGFDEIKIQQYLKEKIAPQIDRERKDVTITQTPEGKIEFEGEGFYSRTLDVKKAAEMIAYALKNDLTYVHLPLIKEEPVITVDEKLKKMGIVELIGAGETSFGGSPRNRIHNIDVGRSKFNGHLIKPGEQFSFLETLGNVDGSTGYLQELVIKGAKTIPEYGGGLCQISSTAYRAALSAGLPITDRRNHSYLVSYYNPPGLDATIYQPAPDMKFVNDTGNHILIQTLVEGNHVYYNFYGTKDGRKVHMIGPHYRGWTGAPPTRTEYTNTLPAGVTKVVGHAVPGLKVSWYRQVEYAKNDPAKKEVTKDAEGKEIPTHQDFLDDIYSNYQARPNYYLIGGSAPAAEGEAATPAESTGG